MTLIKFDKRPHVFVSTPRHIIIDGSFVDVELFGPALAAALSATSTMSSPWPTTPIRPRGRDLSRRRRRHRPHPGQ
jgi:hypothetical protein